MWGLLVVAYKLLTQQQRQQQQQQAPTKTIATTLLYDKEDMCIKKYI